MTSTSVGRDAGRLERGPGGARRGRIVLLHRRVGGVDLVRAVDARADLGGPHEHGRRRVPLGQIGAAQHRGGRALVGGAEHVLGQRVVDHPRAQDLLLGDQVAPEGVGVQRAVAEVLRRHLRQRGRRDAVLVAVAVGVHPEELGRDVLPVLAVPLGQREVGGVADERAPRVLVHPERDRHVGASGSDGVGRGLDGGGRGRTGVEHVGEGDAAEADQVGHRVGVGDRVASPHAELDVAPGHAGVGQGELDGVGGHRHRRLVAEPSERVEAHADDRHVVHDAPPSVAVTGAKANMRTSSPSSSV